MSYTAQQIFDLAVGDLIGKRQASGTIDPAKVNKWQARALGILTAWQNEMAKDGDLYSTYEFNTKPYENMLGDGFNIQEFDGVNELTFEGIGSAKTYYFEVDAPCTVYIEDYDGAWNTVVTKVVPSTVTSFTAYKGAITPTANATKSRIRVTGSTYARIINYALFDIPFYTGREPIYRPWVKYTMPTDFKSVDEIIEEYPARNYDKVSNSKWEGKNNLYIDYYYEGNVRIVYKPVPIVISALSQTLQIDDITSMSACYYLASILLLVEDPSSAAFFNGKFLDLKLEASKKQPQGETKMVDFYGLGVW